MCWYTYIYILSIYLSNRSSLRLQDGLEAASLVDGSPAQETEAEVLPASSASMRAPRNAKSGGSNSKTNSSNNDSNKIENKNNGNKGG